MSEQSPRKRDSDTQEIPQHLRVATQHSLDQYRIDQLEKEVRYIKKDVDGLCDEFTDMKVWRGYILGAIAATGFVLGLVISILGFGWFQWKN